MGTQFRRAKLNPGQSVVRNGGDWETYLDGGRVKYMYAQLQALHLGRTLMQHACVYVWHRACNWAHNLCAQLLTIKEHQLAHDLQAYIALDSAAVP